MGKRGRPRISPVSETVQCTAQIPEHIYNTVVEMARENDTSVSHIVRYLLAIAIRYLQTKRSATNGTETGQNSGSVDNPAAN
jgi:type III secretion system FlhB-like substrate exporter